MTKIVDILERVGLSADRPMQTGLVSAPPVVSIKDGYLIYNAAVRQKRTPGSGLLTSFGDLSTASDAKIFQFARKWGALGIGNNGWPMERTWADELVQNMTEASPRAAFEICITELARRILQYVKNEDWKGAMVFSRELHRDAPLFAAACFANSPSEGDGGSEVLRREKVDSWRLLASRFKAMLNVASELHQGRPGRKEDWPVIDDDRRCDKWYSPRLPWIYGASPYTDLSSYLSKMISQFRVAPRLWWNQQSGQWQLELNAYGLSNLPGLMVIQAMLVIADKDGVAFCSGCHRSYIPTRRPDPTRRNYCEREDCRRRAAWRDSARERRKRTREGKQNAETKTRKQ